MKKTYLIIVRALLLSLIMSLVACQAPKDKSSSWSSASGEVRPGPKTGKAVLALLSKARQASKTGSLSTAESHLERALRIEPQNPTLWLYMAKLRLYAGKSIESIDLAKKAIALSARGGVASTRDRNSLQAESWRVIAHAHLKLNNLEKAHKAQEKSNFLDN